MSHESLEKSRTAGLPPTPGIHLRRGATGVIPHTRFQGMLLEWSDKEIVVVRIASFKTVERMNERISCCPFSRGTDAPWKSL